MLGVQVLSVALNHGVEQLVAHQAHNLKVVGSSPTPVTNCNRMEEQDFEEKKLRVLRAPNLRQLIDAANKVGITKESFISIVPPSVKEGEYTLLYFK